MDVVVLSSESLTNTWSICDGWVSNISDCSGSKYFASSPPPSAPVVMTVLLVTTLRSVPSSNKGFMMIKCTLFHHAMLSHNLIECHMPQTNQYLQALFYLAHPFATKTNIIYIHTPTPAHNFPKQICWWTLVLPFSVVTSVFFVVLLTTSSSFGQQIWFWNLLKKIFIQLYNI